MRFNLKKIQWTKFPMWLWIIVGILVVIRIALPFIGLHVINSALASKLGEYDGRIKDFDLSLYRGAYQLQDLEIRKKNSNLEPILSAKEIDISLAWRRIFSGKISIDVDVDRLIVRIMDSDKKEKKQTGTEEKGWQDALNTVVPISVESLKIKNSAFYFMNNDSSVPLPVQIEGIYGTAEDLQSRTRKPADSLSPFSIEGFVQGHSKLKLMGKIDALAKLPRLDVQYSLVSFHPRTVNALLLTYLPLDLTTGEISIYGEAATSKGEVKGYINVFLKEVDVVAPDQKLISLKHLFIEAATAVANWILKSKEQKTVAAHIPFSRHAGKFDIGYGEAFASAIANRSEPLKKGFDGSISLKDIEKE